MGLGDIVGTKTDPCDTPPVTNCQNYKLHITKLQLLQNVICSHLITVTTASAFHVEFPFPVRGVFLSSLSMSSIHTLSVTIHVVDKYLFARLAHQFNTLFSWKVSLSILPSISTHLSFLQK